MSTKQIPYRIARCVGYQGPRPPVGSQAGVEKYVTGHHYSEVDSSGWSGTKSSRTRFTNTEHHHKIFIGSINTTTLKDPMKLAQCVSHCKFLKHSITFMQETHILEKPIKFENDEELSGWRFINAGLKSKASAGVGIVLSPEVKLIDIDDKILDGRILLVRIILHD